MLEGEEAERGLSAPPRAHGQGRNESPAGEPLLRKAFSSRASVSSTGSSFVRQLSAALGWRFDDDLTENVMGTMLLNNEVLEEIMADRDKDKLDELGGVQSIARGLGSSPKRGLTGSDSLQRKKKYGVNMVERKPPPSFWDLFKEAIMDTTVLILLAAAGVAISLSIITCLADLGTSCPRKPLFGGPVILKDQDGATDCSGWMDGACIIMACLLVGVITAWNEQAKERQFRGLQRVQDDRAVTVKRNGEIVRCQAEDIMVGDLVSIETGSRVPADGLYLRGNELRVDESALTGEPIEVAKNADSPFLLSGSCVTNGEATFLVTAVGFRSEWGKILSELNSDRDETPLQQKLTVLAEQIGMAGTAVAALCFVAQLVIWLYDNGRPTCFFPPGEDGNVTGPVEDCALGYPGLDDEKACLKAGHVWASKYEMWSWMNLKDIVAFFIDSVTIIVVAVPEGLPLAVTIALAYSVKKMQKDHNLVRVMASCETMGGATNICSDKTGTLTQNVMTVVDGYFTGWACEGDLPVPAGKGCRLTPSTLQVITEAIACNSKAEIGFDAKKGKLNEIIGNKTEGALLLFLRALGSDYREVRDRATIVQAYPFSSLKKRMSTVVNVEIGDKVARRLYCKGASEVMLSLCTAYMDQDGSIKRLTPELRARVGQYISKMASQGLRTLTLAYKDLDDSQVLPVAGAGGDDLDKLERDMTLVAACGIKDPLRKEVPDAVRRCQRAGITVRMLTGDSLLTAKNIARDCGILTRDGTAMEGADFRKLTHAQQQDLLRVRELANGQVQTLQVLARCSPQDKLELVRRLKELDQVVAVTGDGTNDAPALKEADVGLSMGIAGTAVAQEASDIVIMDDNFSSIVQSVMWGRSVYDNIRRFLQFQLTVNVTALAICLTGAVTGYGTPLKPVQLLWVNLIMDTFGALALATEDPTADLLNRRPYGRFDALVNGHMWRNIAVQAVFQLVIQLGLLWYGARFLTDCSDGYGTGSKCVPLQPNGQGKNLAGNYRDTVIYNTFVWMQLFNEINCRRIFNELDMMRGVFNNPIFVGIWVLSALVQVASVQFGGDIFHTVPLDAYDWAACLAVGAFSLPLGVFQRFVPICYVAPASSPDDDRDVSTRSNSAGQHGGLHARLLDEGSTFTL